MFLLCSVAFGIVFFSPPLASHNVFGKLSTALELRIGTSNLVIFIVVSDVMMALTPLVPLKDLL